MFQESFLFADTVRENLAMGDDVADDDLRCGPRAHARDRFVDRLPHGLDEVIGERGVTLSGGQRQRLALARPAPAPGCCCSTTPPRRSTPPSSAILDGLRGAVHATTLIVAHRVSTIALADRVVFLDGGRIAAAGTHAELLAAVPAYAALVRAYEDEAVTDRDRGRGSARGGSGEPRNRRRTDVGRNATADDVTTT